jgi:uncharacterized protein YceH (UPF0502 family)
MSRESYEETIKRLMREQRQALNGDEPTLEQRIQKLEIQVADLNKAVHSPYSKK